jgi:hypothetical protein
MVGWIEQRRRQRARAAVPCRVPVLSTRQDAPGWIVANATGRHRVSVIRAVELSGESGAADVLAATRVALDALPDEQTEPLRAELADAERLMLSVAAGELATIRHRLGRVRAILPPHEAAPDLLAELDDATAAVGDWLDRARVHVVLAGVEASRP